jgi:hypothetical protein
LLRHIGSAHCRLEATAEAGDAGDAAPGGFHVRITGAMLTGPGCLAPAVEALLARGQTARGLTIANCTVDPAAFDHAGSLSGVTCLYLGQCSPARPGGLQHSFVPVLRQALARLPQLVDLRVGLSKSTSLASARSFALL